MWCVVVFLKSRTTPDLVGPFPNEDRAKQYIVSCRGPEGYDPDDVLGIGAWPFIIPHCLDVTVKIRF